MSGLPTVQDFPGQSRILNPVLGHPGQGYNVPDFRGVKLRKRIAKSSLQNAENRLFRGQIFVIVFSTQYNINALGETQLYMFCIFQYYILHFV